MKDEQIITALTAKAITIRINGGSQEAQYLAAYYPMPVLPAFIIINNGQLVVDVRAGEGKNQFKAAILKALSSRSSPPQNTTLSQTPNSNQSATQHTSDQPETLDYGPHLGSAASPPSSTQATTFNSHPDALSPTAHDVIDHANMLPSQSQNVGPTAGVTRNAIQSAATPSTSEGGQSSEPVQNLLADRRRRLEIDKKAKDATEKAKQKAKAEARREAVVVAPDSTQAKQATYAAQQRKRQQEAKLERERILRQIEHDKVERKEKEERRKAIAKAEAEGADGADGLVDQQLATEVDSPKLTNSGECAVQVRLFDGSTIRSRFPSNQTLRGNVRPWIDQIKSDDIPYTFKQVVTPMPNRTLSILEEEETLQSLGLSPSATLVTVPVQGYTAAYSGGQGMVLKGVSAGYNVISAGAGIVTGALGTFLGLGRATVQGTLPDTRDTTMRGNAEADTTGTGSGIHIRTLRDQRDDQDDHQLYNGNQVLSSGLLAMHLNWH